jgi:hypothetical protein
VQTWPGAHEHQAGAEHQQQQGAHDELWPHGIAGQHRDEPTDALAHRQLGHQARFPLQ